ncbi:MAG: hypothetical protein GX447_02180 [Elusimicrobia bacterium]|nr:hypothetical protein [Elusimicrobiota bacterium]
MKNTLIFLTAFLTFSSYSSFAASQNKVKPAAISQIELKNFEALDFPYDKGESGLLVWEHTPELEGAQFSVLVSTVSDKEGWIEAVKFSAGENTADKINLPFWSFNKNKNKYAVALEFNNILSSQVKEELNYFAKVKIIKGKNISETKVLSSKIKGNWFRADRLNNLIVFLVVTLVFFIVVSHAKKKGLFIRRIAGLDAIDEAIGRATEMGKPIFYVPGIGVMSQISTIASTFVLGEVAKKVAQYDSYIKVPHYDPIVMTVSKEIVKQAYTEAERPDSYKEDINVFISHDQFSYAANVDGLISREKPAACFYIGYFMAESLLLAEVGASIGAIQIAGTDVDHQLPFFFTACDYTLIGEELYAAGAYLSKEPMLVSALKVQDFGKLVFMISVAVFSLLLIIGAKMEWKGLAGILTEILKVY